MRYPPAMAKMVDIGRKPDVHRRAVASATVRLKASTIRAVRAGRVEKGDPLAAAEVAALHAMKTVWQVLPRTHPASGLDMADERKLSMSEVRKTISTSLGSAFGFVIALVWSNVVLGGLALTGAPMTAPKDPAGLVIGIVVALVLTIFMIVLIIVIGRWGSKA